MSEMIDDRGFLEDDFQQNLDTLRLRKKAEDVVRDLDEYVQEQYGGEVESALLTRSGHYGMSLMADSALMKEKYGHDPEAQEAASKRDVGIETVHGTRISTLGEHPRGASDLMGKARNIELGYDDKGNRTRRLLSPSAIVYHPPYEDDSPDISRRQMMENMVHNVAEFVGSDLPPQADIALENLPTPRGIIHSPRDVHLVDDMAQDYGIAQEIAYTLDTVHTEEPVEMIRAMTESGNLSNVHYSDHIDVSDERVDELKEKYLGDEEELLPWQERPETYTHLPPGEGDEDFEKVFSELDERGYEGPVTMELHDRFKTEEAHRLASETMEEAGYPLD